MDPPTQQTASSGPCHQTAEYSGHNQQTTRELQQPGSQEVKHPAPLPLSCKMHL